MGLPAKRSALPTILRTDLKTIGRSIVDLPIVERALRRVFKDPWGRLWGAALLAGSGLVGAAVLVAFLGWIGIALLLCGGAGLLFVFLGHLLFPASAVHGRILYAYMSGVGQQGGRTDLVRINAAVCYDNGDEKTHLSPPRITLTLGAEEYEVKRYVNVPDVLPYPSIYEVAAQAVVEKRARIAGGVYGMVTLDREREVSRLTATLRIECEDAEGFPVLVEKRISGRDRPDPHAYYPELKQTGLRSASHEKLGVEPCFALALDAHVSENWWVFLRVTNKDYEGSDSFKAQVTEVRGKYMPSPAVPWSIPWREWKSEAREIGPGETQVLELGQFEPEVGKPQTLDDYTPDRFMSSRIDDTRKALRRFEFEGPEPIRNIELVVTVTSATTHNNESWVVNIAPPESFMAAARVSATPSGSET